MEKLKAGDRVLIHTASGGVGLAAVQLAQAAGLEVFATASSPKQAYLRSLGIEHVFDSRTAGFGLEILEVTGGAGVNMVLNSLTGPGFIEASLSCLAVGGSFVEMGRRDIWSAEEMAASRPDVSYSILELDWLKVNEPAVPGAVLRDVMKGMTTGALKPLAHTRWPIAEAGAAMDFMRSARHIGKNVLALPPMAGGRLRPDRTYLVTGGLGGIGIVVAEWLADHGAGVIVLNGRRPPDPEAVEAIEALRRQGSDIRVELADMTDPAAIDAMLARMNAEMPPLAGLFHSVGVLSDGALGNQTWERFEQVLWPKVLGAWHLHKATLDQDLDLFVLFSSITGILGNPGQGNHAAANAYLDQLAAYRRSLGLPGQAIAWGAWSGLGEAEEQRERIERQLSASGTGWITPDQGLRALDQLVRQDVTTSMAAAVDWPVVSENFDNPPPLLEDLLSIPTDTPGVSSAETSSSNLLSRLQDTPEAERENLMQSFLQGEVQAVLRLPTAPATTVGFFELGMDSLMAVELRNRLNRAFSGEYTASNTVVFDYPNIVSLARHIAGELDQSGKTDQPPTRQAPAVPQTRVQSQQAEDGIAIVGMACRFPGAPDLSSFWRLLEEGVNAVTDGRPDAGPWNGMAGDPDAEEAVYRRGAFVEGIDQFDARFFRIAPIAARMMDPQQRMLLETSWQALEDAAIDPNRVRSSRTGVFAGVGSSEYRDLIASSGQDDSYLGTAASVAVGRVAFALGLGGPAMPVDMACASSLAAVHQAVAALQRGDVDLALAGGVNATLSQAFVRFHKDLGMLSAGGQCSAFDAAADGFVRGEGCGMVVLKRLSEAEADGDRIWAVVRGSAVNHNGASAALTVPNGPAQERVMEEALTQGGVSPSDVDYLEAHAVGSQLGDPIELNAVAAVYGKERDRERPLLIGSVKSNIGHLEWAAGIAGLIKTMLAMKHGVIPQHLHFQEPNPNLDWDQMPMRVASAATDWPLHPGKPPLAAVSAFGLSGANAHVVLEGYDAPVGSSAENNGEPWPSGPVTHVTVSMPEAASDPATLEDEHEGREVRLLPLSGKTGRALRESAHRHLEWLDRNANESLLEDAAMNSELSDMAWTAGVGRSHFPYRAGLVFSNLAQLREKLLLQAEMDEGLEESEPEAASRVAFVYAGQGSQWAGMGESLYQSEPVVRAVLDRCDAVVQEERGVSLLDVMFGRSGVDEDLDTPLWNRLAVYALECALTALWDSVGIRPNVALGHGSGGIAAAQASGVLELEEGLRLTIALDDPTGDVSKIASTPPLVALVNNVTGELASSSQTLDVAFWRQSVLEQDPEAFRKCIETLAETGVDMIVGIGPDSEMVPTIVAAWPQTGEGDENSDEPVVLETLKSPSGNNESLTDDGGFVEAVARAYEVGLDISFDGLFAGEKRRRISLPGYPFQRQSYWVETPKQQL